MPVRSSWMLASLALLGSVGCGGTEAGPEAGAELGRTKEALFAYVPMGFIRVAASGASVEQFDSAGGSLVVTVSHTAGSGTYVVNFPSLGSSSNQGHLQVSAEGTGNTRCRATNWGVVSGSTEQVTISCNAPVTGTPTESAFSLLYFRNNPPGGTASWPADTAYAYVSAAGALSSTSNFNNAGGTNSVLHPSTGVYNVTFGTISATANAGLMVSAYGGSGAPFCQIGGFSKGVINVLCWDSSGAAADSDFFVSYATTGPAITQQGGHARFTGGALVPSQSAALGRYVACSSASVSASLSSGTATVQVTGDLGPFSAGPFYRASFASGYGSTPLYCRVTGLTVSGTFSSNTATSTVQCHDGAGGGKNITPSFTFTHTTSEAAGPC